MVVFAQLFWDFEFVGADVKPAVAVVIGGFHFYKTVFAVGIVGVYVITHAVIF